jgi:hypothetical protein
VCDGARGAASSTMPTCVYLRTGATAARTTGSHPAPSPWRYGASLMSQHGTTDAPSGSDLFEGAGPSAREQLLARVALVVVGAGYLLAQFLLIPADRLPGWDESIYLSQVTPEMHAMLLRAFRARGITFLVSPVTMLGGSVEHVRLFLMILSSIATTATFQVLIPLVGVAAPIAAVLFAFSWLSLVNGSAVLPNLWTAILGLAAAGLTARRLAGGGTRSALLAAASLGAMASFRPTEAVVMVAAIGLSVLLVRRTSWRLIVMLWIGVVVGLIPWILETSIRFGGPLEALRTAHTDRHLGIADAGTNLAWYLAAADGGQSGEISAGSLVWWSLLLVLSVVAIARSRRPRRTVVILCAIGTVLFAAEYIVFVSAVAARFLLPAYALASIPAAVGLVSLFRNGILAKWAGSVVLLLVIPWMLWQVGVAGRLAEGQGGQLINEISVKLRELADGRPCAFMSPLGWPSIEFASGCRGTDLPRPRGPSERELRELSIGSERTFVILRTKARPRSLLGSLTPIPVRGPDRTWFVYVVSLAPQ